MSELELIASWLRSGPRSIGFTGAGISTESGIPDYRSPGGVWTRYDPREFTYQRYIADPEVRKLSWQIRTEVVGLNPKPNAGHKALAALEASGHLDAVITQNIDGLHADAGSTVLEIHGTMRDVVCITCSFTCTMLDALARVEAGEADPDCPDCGGILKSATISFGQPLDQEVVHQARQLASDCSLLLVVGSSLVVHPAAGLPRVAKRAGAKVAIINREPTAADHLADAVIHAEAGETLAALVEAVDSNQP